MEWEKVIELTFKVVMILASLGLVWKLIRTLFIKIKTIIKKYLFRFENVEKRLRVLEGKMNRRKPKKKATKSNERKDNG